MTSKAIPVSPGVVVKSKSAYEGFLSNHLYISTLFISSSDDSEIFTKEPDKCPIE